MQAGGRYAADKYTSLLSMGCFMGCYEVSTDYGVAVIVVSGPGTALHTADIVDVQLALNYYKCMLSSLHPFASKLTMFSRVLDGTCGAVLNASTAYRVLWCAKQMTFPSKLPDAFR